MKTILMAYGLLFVLTIGAAGCGFGGGSCTASGGLVDECKQDWTRAECDEWDGLQVNDASWSYSSKSCESLGFDIECADGSFVRTSSDC